VQIIRLQKDLEIGKGKENNFEPEPSPAGGMGINTNPLNYPKKLSGEDKIIGRKPYREKIEKIGALMVDFGQVVCLRTTTPPPPPPPTQKLIMKITSWNIRGMNISSK
jgi:hypothetical protein